MKLPGMATLTYLGSCESCLGNLASCVLPPGQVNPDSSKKLPSQAAHPSCVQLSGSEDPEASALLCASSVATPS